MLFRSDIHGDMIYTDDILKIKGEYTGEIFKQHGRWLVAVETLRFMFPVTILWQGLHTSLIFGKIVHVVNSNDYYLIKRRQMGEKR